MPGDECERAGGSVIDLEKQQKGDVLLVVVELSCMAAATATAVAVAVLEAEVGIVAVAVAASLHRPDCDSVREDMVLDPALHTAVAVVAVVVAVDDVTADVAAAAEWDTLVEKRHILLAQQQP